MKKQPKDWDKILTIHISDKQLTFNYIRNSYNSTVIIILLKMGRKTHQTISKKKYKVYKKCSALLIIQEMLVKTIMRYHLIPVKIAVIKETSDNKCCQGCREKREHLCTISENVNWYSHYEKQCEGLQKIRNRISYNPVI